MSTSQAEKYHLAMAGEYFVAAQLQRLGLLASVTYGNAKRADVLALSESSDRVVIVEVKTTRKLQWTFSGRISTKSQKPWVFVHLPENNLMPPRFFVLTQSELHDILDPIDKKYLERYKEKHGVEYGNKPWMVNVSLEFLFEHENNWAAIIDQI